jgi:histidine ammonia-lyase
MDHTITTDHLSLLQVKAILSGNAALKLSDETRQRIAHCRAWLDDKIATSEAPIYGVNTGFGALCNTIIAPEYLRELQRNLVMSHAAGTGREVSEELVRLMLLLKIQGLSQGYSGVSTELVDRLIWHYNEGVLPVVYEQGSLGASGDLAPLAHLSLPLIGLGEVMHKGHRKSAAEVLREYGLAPLDLRPKEGLALLNGTQFMSAYGVHVLLKAMELSQWADLIACASLEAYDGRPEPFIDIVHAVRHHKGQREVATRIRSILQGSQTIHLTKVHVQDPYSFRCVPQVHGAALDALNYALGVFENEINAVTDNPTVFPEEGLVISAGNFHGEPLAMALDFACIALAEIGSISERRTYKLLHGQRGLPAFLVANPGLNSGFMIAHYTAASIVSKNKQLCTPASVDTIDSSNGQEDHVSMGANAAVKALEVCNNLGTLLGIELLEAMQALDLRGSEYHCAPAVKALHKAFRSVVPFMQNDQPMYELIEGARKFVTARNLSEWVK